MCIRDRFDDNGHLLPYLKKLVPYNPMGANPNANGGLLLQELKVPSIDKYAVKFTHPGEIEKEDMRVLGEFIRDIIKEIYDVIRDKESIICEKQIDLELYLACIENKRILPLDFKLEESGVENGNRLILF